jgi:hypothetical protein
MQVVGIHPPAELEIRPALFAALSEAFPTVRFEARQAGAWAGLDALIELGGGQAEACAAAAAGTPALAALQSESGPGQTIDVALADNAGLDRRLRGQTLNDRHLGALTPLTAETGTEVLASASSAGPLWTRRERLDVVAIAPEELAAGEPLRARLGRGRSLALLPLLELLRSLTKDEGWQPPPLRATFLLDDPNLHWPSYGHLKLPELAQHSREHGYHLALAMVPLDAWFAHPTAAAALHDQRSLSLLVHGNDHFGGELGDVDAAAKALELVAQAQRRSDAFERRTAIPVSRVMAPPHEECSEIAARALARTGFDAITMTRPYPWLALKQAGWLMAPAGAGALAGWRPADLTPGNLPVLLRHPLSDQNCSPAELVLRAYLDQALILYGHHDDLADGLGVLSRRTTEVNRLGHARWSSLAEIAATSFEQRRDGNLLRLRPYTRRIAAEVPDGVTHVVIEPPPGFEPGERVRYSTETTPVGEPFPISAERPLELSLEASDAVAPGSVPAPRRRPWPLARRIAGEARDRVAPVKKRALARR